MASPVRSSPKTDLTTTAARQLAEFTDSRGTQRFPLSTPVRIGWICDGGRMTYADAQGIDRSEHGIAIQMPERLRFSALVHLELPGCRLTAIGRVTSCVRSGAAFRVGFELVDAFRAAPDGL